MSAVYLSFLDFFLPVVIINQDRDTGISCFSIKCASLHNVDINKVIHYFDNMNILLAQVTSCIVHRITFSFRPTVRHENCLYLVQVVSLCVAALTLTFQLLDHLRIAFILLKDNTIRSKIPYRLIVIRKFIRA